MARVATGVYEHAHPPEPPDQVAWQSPEGAVARARAAGKPILYDFTADWCPPCRLMQREVFADRRSAATIERLFVPVRVLDRAREEGRNAPEVQALEERFKVDGFPTLVVAPPEGGEPVVVNGYPGRDRTLSALVQAATRIEFGRRPAAPAGDSAARGRDASLSTGSLRSDSAGGGATP